MAIQQIGWPSSGLLTAIRVVAIRGGSVVAASVYQHTAAYMVWMWYVLPAGCRAVQHPAWLGCAFRHTCELAPSTAQMAIQQRSTAIKVGCAAFASLSALCFPGQDGLGYTRYSLSHTDKHPSPPPPPCHSHTRTRRTRRRYRGPEPLLRPRPRRRPFRPPRRRTAAVHPAVRPKERFDIRIAS